MSISKFEDLVTWQKSQDIAVVIYEKFRESRDFGFRDQICRAVVSISNNIAEGFERKGKKEFKQYLHIALGSASEVKSMIYLAGRLKYITQSEQDVMLQNIDEVCRLVYGLIRSIKT
jgi:four helix bundle protein